MKIIPLKYQQGGSLFLPVNVQLERANPHYMGMLSKGDEGSSSSSSKKSSGSKSSDDEIADILKVLGNNVLPNEAEVFYNKAAKLYRMADAGQPITSSMILGLKKDLPRLVHNHKQVESAQQNMFQKGTQDEYAISSDGSLYNVKKDGSVELVPINKYNPEKHTKILRNSELLQMRAYSPQFVYDVSTFSTINDGQSSQQIVEFIDKILNKAKGSESKEEFTTNIKFLNAAAGSGIDTPTYQALVGLANAGLTGEQLVNYSSSTNNPAVIAALNYIQKVMPRAMTNYLYAKAMIDGGMTYKQVKDSNFIGQLFTEAASTYSKYDLSITADSTKTGAAKNSGSGSQVVHTATQGFFHRTQPRQFALTDSSYSTSLDIVAPAGVGLLLDTKDQSAMSSPMTIQIALEGGKSGKGTGWGKYCEHDSIWVGGMKLPYDMLNTIIYDNAETAQVALPVKNGELDTELLQRISKAFNDYKRTHNKSTLDSQEKQQALKESFVEGVSVNPDGSLSYNSSMAEFLVVYGYLNDDDDSDQGIKYDEHLKDIRYYKELTGTDRAIAKSKIDNAEGYQGDEVNFYDKIYKAPIFIKLASNYSSLVEYDAKSVKENPLDEHTLNVHDVKHQQILQGASHSSSRLGN